MVLNLEIIHPIAMTLDLKMVDPVATGTPLADPKMVFSFPFRQETPAISLLILAQNLILRPVNTEID